MYKNKNITVTSINILKRLTTRLCLYCLKLLNTSIRPEASVYEFVETFITNFIAL